MKKQPKGTKETLNKKKKYEKPQIINTCKIQTLAGSCASDGGCEPAYT